MDEIANELVTGSLVVIDDLIDAFILTNILIITSVLIVIAIVLTDNF